MSKLNLALAIAGQAPKAKTAPQVVASSKSDLDAIWAKIPANDKTIRGGQRIVLLKGKLLPLEDYAKIKAAEGYQSLNDAPGLEPGAIKIWYMKDDAFRDFGMGYRFLKDTPEKIPTPETIEKTHTLLGEVAETDMEALFEKLQGENWSPNGEARGLLDGKGLHHTSMSVGDIIQLDDLFMVDSSGFVHLGTGVKGSKDTLHLIKAAEDVAKHFTKTGENSFKHKHSDAQVYLPLTSTNWVSNKDGKLAEHETAQKAMQAVHGGIKAADAAEIDALKAIPAPAEAKAPAKSKETEDEHYDALKPGKKPAVVVLNVPAKDGHLYEAKTVSTEQLNKPGVEFALAQWCETEAEAKKLAKVLEGARADKTPLPDTWPAGKSPQALSEDEIKKLPTAADNINKIRRADVTASVIKVKAGQKLFHMELEGRSTSFDSYGATEEEAKQAMDKGIRSYFSDPQSSGILDDFLRYLDEGGYSVWERELGAAYVEGRDEILAFKASPTSKKKLLANMAARRALRLRKVKGSYNPSWYADVVKAHPNLGELNRGPIGRQANRIMEIFSRALDTVAAKNGDIQWHRGTMDANRSALAREILKRIKPGVNPAVYLILEDENFHFLNELLGDLGLFGTPEAPAGPTAPSEATELLGARKASIVRAALKASEDDDFDSFMKEYDAKQAEAMKKVPAAGYSLGAIELEPSDHDDGDGPSPMFMIDILKDGKVIGMAEDDGWGGGTQVSVGDGDLVDGITLEDLEYFIDGAVEISIQEHNSKPKKKSKKKTDVQLLEEMIEKAARKGLTERDGADLDKMIDRAEGKPKKKKVKGAAEGEATLPTGEVEFEIPTKSLMKMLGMEPKDAWELVEDVDPYWISDEEAADLAESFGLEVPRDEDGKPTPEADELLQNVKQAHGDAEKWDLERAVWDAQKSAIEQAMETFSDYPYEYPGLADFDNGIEQHYHGKATGLLGIKIDYDKTWIKVDMDFAHILGDMLAGDGTFAPIVDPTHPDTLFSADGIKSHFHWLRSYGDIYGDSSADAQHIYEKSVERYQPSAETKDIKEALKGLGVEVQGSTKADVLAAAKKGWKERRAKRKAVHQEEGMETCYNCGQLLDPEKGEVFIDDNSGDIYCNDCYPEQEVEGSKKDPKLKDMACEICGEDAFINHEGTYVCKVHHKGMLQKEAEDGDIYTASLKGGARQRRPFAGRSVRATKVRGARAEFGDGEEEDDRGYSDTSIIDQFDISDNGPSEDPTWGGRMPEANVSVTAIGAMNYEDAAQAILAALEKKGWEVPTALRQALDTPTTSHPDVLTYLTNEIAAQIAAGDMDLEGGTPEEAAQEAIDRGWTDASYGLTVRFTTKPKEATGEEVPVEGDDFQRVKAIIDNFFTKFPDLKHDTRLWTGAEWAKKEGPDSQPGAVAVLSFEGPFYHEVNYSDGRRSNMLLKTMEDAGYSYMQDHAWDMGFYKKS